MDNASSRPFLHLLEAETLFGMDDSALFAIESSGNFTPAVNASHCPEVPNYHLIAAKVGFRAENRENGGLVFHEAPVKFP